ncbi:hypothetical protein F5Y15DRAFT_428409 [Xylariaceae sp. FL0016]|nr:hypothetical protein F5Y15DRAFT_428409 [Xylariaceae sp. FL0016]
MAPSHVNRNPHPYLMKLMPKRGLNFAEHPTVCARGQRDGEIMRAIKASFPMTREGVENAMISIIDTARELKLKEVSGIFYRELRPVQDALPWARQIRPAIFFELFCRLVEAQVSWNNERSPPFDRTEHSRLAICIRELRKEFDNYPEDDSTRRGHIINDDKSWIIESWNMGRLRRADQEVEWFEEGDPTITALGREQDNAVEVDEHKDDIEMIDAQQPGEDMDHQQLAEETVEEVRSRLGEISLEELSYVCE